MTPVRISLSFLLFALPLFAFQRPQGPAVSRAGSAFAIAGTITDDDGKPLRGVLVRALQPTFDTNGATNLTPVSRATTTDDFGNYVLRGLPADVYLVSVDPPPAG